MTQTTVIDTDILIDVSRATAPAINRLATEAQTATLAISVVTYMELVVGCRNQSELQTLEKFLQQFQVLKLNESISDEALSLVCTYRLSHGLLIPDALIAATAIATQSSLLTKNQKDYRFIPNLMLLPYP